MSKSRVHNRQKTIYWNQDLLNSDTEKKQGEGDTNEGVHHTEDLAWSGQRSLLPISNGSYDSAGEEERLTKTPIGSFLRCKSNSPPAVMSDRRNVIIKIGSWNCMRFLPICGLLNAKPSN